MKIYNLSDKKWEKKLDDVYDVCCILREHFCEYAFLFDV